ncbi:SDR family NAD(P)-dependent oxidoreductase [Rhodococcus globerulus]|jgi:NAD(P)-dependent dehydrogenase (short-subunit alcohol dehydrogenase family)|uniref:SDR family NAD(P)-dependent oxidoreductase n=1 Tax=Rhodococcus globerulus TaxID=33008 RepID=UPI00301947D4
MSVSRSNAQLAAFSGIAGRRVIITGGASGMGAGLVVAFSAHGAQVVSLDIEESVGAAIASDAGATFVKCDVSEQLSVDGAVTRAVEELGGLDVLIHAAGIAPGASAESTPVDLWRQVLDINATGTFLTNQAAFRHMKGSGGRIINFSSAAGAKGYPGKSAYAASKGAVLAWVRSVAVEWAPFGITVNAIAPAIWTPMYDRTRASMTEEQLAQHDRDLIGSIPVGGKLGDIDADLVPVLEFLAGDGSRFMTGQVFAVDGGGLMVR